jgi:hypothetical protein
VGTLFLLPIFYEWTMKGEKKAGERLKAEKTACQVPAYWTK